MPSAITRSPGFTLQLRSAPSRRNRRFSQCEWQWIEIRNLCKQATIRPLALLWLHWWGQRNCRLGREKQKGKRLLQVQCDSRIGVAQIPNGDVLANVQVEIAATGSHHKCALDSGGPDDLVVEETLDVFEHGISVIAGLRQRRVCVCAEQYRVGAIDAYKPQLAQPLSNGIRILPHIVRKSHGRIAGPLPDANDSGIRIAFEDGPVLGISYLARGILGRLPV